MLKEGIIMTVLKYDPDLIKNWASRIIGKVNDGSENSFSTVTKQLGEILNKVASEKYWTGAAAAKNYTDFVETNNNFIKFLNDFGKTFSESMQEFNSNINELEVTNLGQATNVANEFGQLSYVQVNETLKESIETSEVTYDYDALIELSNQARNVRDSIDEVKNNLFNIISEVGENGNFWTGVAAEKTKQELINLLNQRLAKVKEGLEVCINNFETAANNAKAADK